MDRQNSGFEDDDGEYSAADAGIDSPPLIGQDERRMHVRAYNFWAKLLDGRSFPSIEALDVENLGDFGPHSVLLDFTSGIENPAIGFLGASLAHECELDDNIQYIADVPRKSLLSRLTDHYLQIIANRAPIGFEAEFVNSRGTSILYRGVLMPFSSDDDTIDFILGVINWKQAAEAGLSDAIVEEMAAAAAAPPPLSRPTLPVWSDGPDSAHDDDGYGCDDDDGDEIDRAVNAFDPLPQFRPLASVGAKFAARLPAFDDGGLLRKAGQPGLADAGVDTDRMIDDDLVLSADLAVDASARLGLADWLAAARASAHVAAQANARGHAALYLAIGRAWGFACAAANAPDDYAELLDEAGIATSPRAPLTPVVKLVFGAAHDKTRVAEYAAVLGHAAQQGIGPDALPDYLSGYSGGLKGLVRDVRAAARSSRPAVDRRADDAALLAGAPVLASLGTEFIDSESEFVLLLARREADGSLSIIGHRDGDSALTVRAMRDIARHQSS